eukprot:174591-Rhodomonas_salina.1
MLREINALLILQLQLHIARETAVKEGEAVWKQVRGDYNARMIKLATKLVLTPEKIRLRLSDSPHPLATWKWVIEKINDCVRERRACHQKEVDNAKQQQLQTSTMILAGRSKPSDRLSFRTLRSSSSGG